MKVDEIHEAALVQALQEALTANLDNHDGFKTSRELLAELDCTHQKLLDKLHWLKRHGRLETDYIYIENLAGKRQSVPAYKLISADSAISTDVERG